MHYPQVYSLMAHPPTSKHQIASFNNHCAAGLTVAAMPATHRARTLHAFERFLAPIRPAYHPQKTHDLNATARPIRCGAPIKNHGSRFDDDNSVNAASSAFLRGKKIQQNTKLSAAKPLATTVRC